MPVHGSNPATKGDRKDKKDRKATKDKKDRSATKKIGKENKPKARTLTEFEYGELFSRYAGSEKTEGLTREQFSTLMEDLKIPGPVPLKDPRGLGDLEGNLTPRTKFDAGVQFAKYDKDGNGLIDKESFQHILKDIMMQKQGNVVPNRSVQTLPPYALQNSLSQQHSPQRQWRSVDEVTRNRGSWYVPKVAHAKSLPPYYTSQQYHPSVPFTTASVSQSDYRSPGESTNPHEINIRRDYLALRSQIEAILLPRKDAEINVVYDISEKQHRVINQGESIADDSVRFLKKVISNIHTQTDGKLKRLNFIKEKHLSCLERIFQFEQLAFGRHPEEAVGDLTNQYRKNSVLWQPAGSSKQHRELQKEGIDFVKQFDISRENLQQSDAATAQPALPAMDSLSTSSMVEFVRNFPELRSKAERLVGNLSSGDEPNRHSGTPGGESVEGVESEPFIDEMGELRSQAAKGTELEREVAEKEKMVWMLVEQKESWDRERQEYEQEKEQMFVQVEELTRASTDEVAHWVQLTDRLTEDFSNQIAQLQEENRVLQEANEALKLQIKPENKP